MLAIATCPTSLLFLARRVALNSKEALLYMRAFCCYPFYQKWKEALVMILTRDN